MNDCNELENKEMIYVLEAWYRVEESGVERRIVLGQWDATVEVDQLGHGGESVRFRKAIEGIAAAYLDELVRTAFTQR